MSSTVSESLPATTWRFVRIQPFGLKMTPEPTPCSGSSRAFGSTLPVTIRTTAGPALAATSTTAEFSSIVTGWRTEVGSAFGRPGRPPPAVEGARGRSVRRTCHRTRATADEERGGEDRADAGAATRRAADRRRCDRRGDRTRGGLEPVLGGRRVRQPGRSSWRRTTRSGAAGAGEKTELSIGWVSSSWGTSRRSVMNHWLSEGSVRAGRSGGRLVVRAGKAALCPFRPGDRGR